MADESAQPEALTRWQKLWRRPKRWWMLGIPLGGFMFLVIGALGWATFETTLHYTNSYKFCTSCHEMSDNMQAEYEQSPHFKNTAGVRAICSDCHVPRAFFPKMKAKLLASINELPKWAMGTRRPPEKFAAARLEMAKHVWENMKATDSRECRGCHSIEAMDVAAQDS